MKRGIISFVFDDGYTEIFSDALPMLEKYGIKATIAVPTETANLARTEKANVIPLIEWKEYCARTGHDLAAHGTKHSPLASLSEEQIRTELLESKKATGAEVFVYPGGSFDSRVKKLTAEYFSAGRITKRGLESLPPKDNYELLTFNATQSNFAIWKWNLLALRALAEKKWLIETFHHVDRPDKIHSVQLSELESHIKFIRRLPVRLATVKQVISEYQK